MLSTDQINDLHRLYWSEHWPIRKIERQLNMGWKTIRKYLDAPAQGPVHRDRPSKLDPFKVAITEWIEKDPVVTAAVIEQKLRHVGYRGGHSILREYVRNIRPKVAPRRAFVRMEPLAGERFEVDWGHFGALNYSGDSRKLYAFALVDAHSRMLYVEFTHSQSFQTFARCHIHAFTALGGVAREIAYDNLATAVAEHDGRLVRFLPRFLGFAREYAFVPHACNPASGWEKGKVERAIGYLRQNFWPLREFTSLHDVNHQVRQWLAEVANQRLHRETRERPLERFQPETLRPLPIIPTTTATHRKRWFTKISGFRSMAIVIACPIATSAGGSPSKRTPVPSPSMIASKKSSAMLAPGVGVRLSERSVSKGCSPKSAPRRAVRRRNCGCSIHSTASVRDHWWKLISATWPIPTGRWAVRSRNCSNSYGSMGRRM
jgi:transposase